MAMAEEILEDITPSLEKVISSQDYVLIFKVAKGDWDLDYLTVQSKWFVNKVANSYQPDYQKFGLTAVIFDTFFRHNLPEKEHQQIQQILQTAKVKSAVVNNLLQSMAELDDKVKAYFEAPPSDHGIWLPKRLPSELANIIMGLQVHYKARNTIRQLQEWGKDSFVLEPFRDPNTLMWGVWMSTQGLHFLDKKD